jgi:hypothetical protein
MRLHRGRAVFADDPRGAGPTDPDPGVARAPSGGAGPACCLPVVRLAIGLASSDLAPRSARKSRLEAGAVLVSEFAAELANQGGKSSWG